MLYREPKLLKGADTSLMTFVCEVSVLYREPKLLKDAYYFRDILPALCFSALP